MKRIIVRARSERTDDIKNIISENVHYISHENGFVAATVYAVDSDVDALIEALRGCVDLRYKESLIEVSDPDFVISSALDRDFQKKKLPKKTPVELLMDTIGPYAGIDATKLMLVSIAGLIALTGLYLDNVAVIIGAMLLSPLLGPIYAFIIYVVTGKQEKALRALSNTLLQIVLLIVLSAATTYVLGFFVEIAYTDEILLRLSVSPVYIVMAVLLGFAAVLAYIKGISESVAGVAVAAALVPPAVVTGMMIVLDATRAHMPLEILVDNVVGLITGGLVATIMLGIVPRSYYERNEAKKILQRMLAALAILLSILALRSIA